ncbi:MAG TPA: PBP1A family penicillin-binding protein [Pseudogracilibacillus sp.]|nr:PBP1A family penicillin-binding protein [Pseudogracilibacillus sp.]
MSEQRRRRRRTNRDDIENNRSKRRSDRHKQPSNVWHRIKNKLPRLRRTKQSKRNFSWSWKTILLSFGIVFVLALIAYTTILYGGRLIADPNKLHITPPTTIETEEGEIIWYIYDEYRLPVKLEEVPDHVIDAVISIEDKRFYEHSGVDFRSIVRALYRDLIARSKVEGASTITQQLAKNLFLTNEKTWLRKTKEAMIALYLEREFTKDEILEMYLNVVYFGQGQYGIEAAANKYFYKSVDELTLEEGALLAGMLKAPNGYSPIEHPEKAESRRNVVLEAMAEQGKITSEEKEAAVEKEMVLDVSQRKLNPAYHTIVDMAIKEAEELYGITHDELKQNRYRIVTSMKEHMQQVAYDQFQHDGYFPGNDKNTVEGAFVMMDSETGEIVAALGGRRFETFDLNRVFVKRQPGSTMKPIAVYAPALDTAQFEPYSMLEDELRDWNGKEIRNYDNVYEGNVTLYDALRKSKNASSVWLLNEIGVDTSKAYLTKLGIDIVDNDLGIALGGLEEGVTPIQLVESYRTFVQAGEKIDAHLIKEIYDELGDIIAVAEPEETTVFSPQVAWDMVEMLRSVVTSGTGQAGYYPYELAGKTGTTQHPKVEGESKDAWFVGFTPEYVTALWIGYDESDESHYLTGGSAYPTELTKKILTEASQHESLATTFVQPENVQALAEPVELPHITDLESSYVFGGWKLLKGKLTWTGEKDERISYRIYEKKQDGDKQIGEVKGKTEFIIDNYSLFTTNTYYVVPYDTIANREGSPSNEVILTF